MTIDYERFWSPDPAPGGWTPERADEWYRIGAEIKADHVVELLRDAGAEAINDVSVLEVGCGDGQVLAELGRRGLGPELVGVEISRTAAELARAQPGVTRVEVFDGRTLPFADDEFALVLATHVLEHVHDPDQLLREMARVAAAIVVVEVPLEHNLSARRPHARELSAHVGHVQRFNRGAVRRLLNDAGLLLASELEDSLPRRVLAFHDGPTKGTAKWLVRSALARLPGGHHLMTVHYAALGMKPHGRWQQQPAWDESRK
jgi:SAM-dependent methyltransferase